VRFNSCLQSVRLRAFDELSFFFIARSSYLLVVQVVQAGQKWEDDAAFSSGRSGVNFCLRSSHTHAGGSHNKIAVFVDSANGKEVEDHGTLILNIASSFLYQNLGKLETWQKQVDPAGIGSFKFRL